MEEDDLKWLWAAYKQGAFSWLERNLEPRKFQQKTYQLLASVDEAVLVHSSNRPIGLISLRSDTHDNAEVHAEWFGWATSRNIMEGSARFLSDVGRRLNLLIYAEMKHKRFFERLMRYGLINRVGHVNGFFKTGEKAAMYQSRMK